MKTIPEEVLRQLRSRVSISSGLSLSILASFVPSIGLSLAGGFLFGELGMLTFLLLPGTLFLDFLLHRTSATRPPFVIRNAIRTIMKRYSDLSESLRVNLENPEYTRSCYRALWAEHHDNGWKYMDRLLFTALRQPGAERDKLLKEIPLYLDQRPEEEIQEHLIPLSAKFLADLNITLAIAPPPNLEHLV
jgi:hypothetical protein